MLRCTSCTSPSGLQPQNTPHAHMRIYGYVFYDSAVCMQVFLFQKRAKTRRVSVVFNDKSIRTYILFIQLHVYGRLKTAITRSKF